MFYILVAINIFTESKPDTNFVFNYYIACATGDVKTAEDFLAQYSNCVDIELSLDVFPKDIDQETLSNLAYQKFASYLISRGIVSGFKNKDKENEFIKNYKRYPIIIASQYGNLEIVKLLISYHTNLELKDEYENTALIRASQNDHLDIIKELVNNDADIETHQGVILRMAAENGYKEVIEYFLKKGVNVDSKDPNGNTALVHASLLNQLNIVKYLLENGADVNAGSTVTPLMAASYVGNKDIAAFLIRNKANVNIKGDKGLSALTLAATNGHSEIVSLLLKNKADINAKSDEGVTALIAASAGGHITIVEELLKNKADVNVKTNDGYTAMRAAITNGNTDVVKLLMEYEADLLGDLAAIYIDICEALLKQHSDIACMILKDDRYRRIFFNSSITQYYTKDGIDMTLLMYAAKERFVDFTKLLIENNVDINESNSDGLLALMLAALNGQLEIVNILVDAGADINARNNEGFSVLQYAAYGAKESNDTNVFTLLYLLGATYDE